jgi:hypothetical protein
MLTYVLTRQLHLSRLTPKKIHYTQPSPNMYVTKTNSIVTRLVTKNFDRSKMNDQKISIANPMAIKSFSFLSYGNQSFPSPIMWQLIFFLSPYIRQLKAFILDFNCPTNAGLSHH